MKPLENYILPDITSQGNFGAIRKHDIHTGIDLYCKENDIVYSIEDGVVINICNFTGKNAGSDWWNETKAVLVEGPSGVILYGEVEPLIKLNQKLKSGDIIGKVLRVLKKDKGLPMDMLHLELYKLGYRGDGEVWKETKPEMLLDPTKLIK